MKKLLMLFICLGLALALRGQITIQHAGTLKEFLSILYKEYGYSFMYSNEDINDKQNFSINLSDSNIEELLRELAQKVSVDYEMKNKIVILKSKKNQKQSDAITQKPISSKNEIYQAKQEIIISEKIEGEKIALETSVFKLAETNIDIASYHAGLSKMNFNFLKETEMRQPDVNLRETTSNINKHAGFERKWNFSLHSNLLYDAVLIPNLGVEVKINEKIGFVLYGSWGHMNWIEGTRKYRLWSAGGEIRYYFLEKKNFYAGGIFQVGELNYKFSEVGRQGNFMSGGVATGYTIRIDKNLNLDLGVGFGYNYFDYERYKFIQGVNMRDGKETDKKWFPCKAGISLVWQIK